MSGVDYDMLLPVAFTLEAGLLLLLVGFLAYQRKNVPAFAVLLAAGVSGVFGQLDHISEVSASATNLTIKVREASDALERLKRLAVVTGIALVRVDDSLGLYGPDTAVHRDKLKKDVLELLRSTGVQNADVEPLITIERDDDYQDYLSAIRRHVYRVLLNTSNAKGSEWNKEFKQNNQLRTLTPDEVAELFRNYGIDDSFSQRILADFRNFAATGRHVDPDFWAGRDTWPDNVPPSVLTVP